MARFHINPVTFDVSLCKTTTGHCPFGGVGGSENHFQNRQDGLAAVEILHRSKNEEAYKRIDSMITYSAKAMADRATENIRRLADTHWTSPFDHKRYLKRFIGVIGARCFYCGTEKNVYLNDHITSADKGGITVVGNIGSACGTCNMKKGSMNGSQWFAKELENPEFSHEVFGRDVEAFEKFMQEYQRPYLKNRLYAEDVKLAKRINEGDPTAVDELTVKAELNFINWQYSVMPPANGADYSTEERLNFAVRWRRGEFKAEKDSALKRYESSEHPIWKKLSENSKNASETTRRGYFSAMETVLRTVRDYDYSTGKALESFNDTVYDSQGRQITQGNAGNLLKAIKIIREVGLGQTKTALKDD